LEVRKKHWTTTIGQAAGHPAAFAFAIVLSYAGLWLTFMPQHLTGTPLLRDDLAGGALPSSLAAFVDSHVGPDRQLTLRLA
jgi:hypothetical protein